MKPSETDLLMGDDAQQESGDEKNFNMHTSNVEELIMPRDQRFEEIKEKIKRIILGEDESGELLMQRTGSMHESKEILSHLEHIKNPKFGIRLAPGVTVDFMQKYYEAKVLIMGVNRKKVFAFGYKENKNKIPYEYFMIDSIKLDMKESCQYMARSKLDNGVVFCSNDEIFSITFNSEENKLVKTTHLKLGVVCEVLDTKNGTEKVKHDYTHVTDDSLCFGEAKLFVSNQEEPKTHLMFTIFSEHNINRNREVEKKDSTIVCVMRYEDEEITVDSKWKITKYLQTMGRITNLTLVKSVSKANKIYYIRKKEILENYLKSFNNTLDTKKSFRINEFNYEKIIYKDSTDIEQFEFDRLKKHILALMDGKVKKLFKYNKKKIPIYFEQENSVADFAVSGDFLYTGDMRSTLKIWNPKKNRIINDLNLKVSKQTIEEFMSLDGIEKDKDIFMDSPTEEQEEACIVDIIVNDDFSELIVIMSDKVIFWQIPFMMAETKVGYDMSQNSHVCFMDDGTTFMLNCGNRLIQKHRNDSLRMLLKKPLPDYTYLARIISNGEMIIAYKDKPKKEGEKELSQEEIAAIEAPTIIKRLFGQNLKHEEVIHTTESVVTSMDIVYKKYLGGQFGVADLPELAVLFILNHSDLSISRRQDDGEYITKIIPKVAVDDPNFMKSAQNPESNLVIQNSEDPKAKLGNLYATEHTQTFGESQTHGGQNLRDDLMGSSRANNVQEQGSKFEHFEYFRELNYFIGYMSQWVSSTERKIHFIAFNPFRSERPRIVVPNVLTEELKENSEPSKYRIFLERKDTGEYSIGMNSNMGSFILEFNKIDGKISNLMNFAQKSNPKVSGQITYESAFVFLPYQNKLEVFDYHSQDKVYTLETQKNILEVYKTFDGNFLCLMDSVSMYVVDVNKMIFIQKKSLTNREHQTKMSIINLPFFPHLREYRLPELIQDVNVIKIVDDTKITGLRYMPVDILAKCFSEKDNKDSIIAFGEFYSETITNSNGFDYIFGPLNPYIFTIYYSDEQTLQYLLENFEYPRAVESFYTPLEYTFMKNENDCLRIICNLLTKHKNNIYFTEDEFKYLLESEFVFCDTLMASVPLKIPFKKINLAEPMQEDNDVRYKDSLKQFLLENEKRQYEMENNPTAEEKEISRERFEIKFVPFKYNFTPGSTESMDFLQYYSDSESEEFVKSHWQTIIHNKWNSLKSIYAFNAIIFWIYMFFCTWSITFNLNVTESGLIIGEQIVLVRYIALGLNIVIAFLEVLQMISYCLYKPSLYFGDFWNYIDFFALIFAFLFFISLHEQATEGGSVFIALILMILIYYRGFSYFRYFDTFTSMIGIINTIVGESLSFFGVMFYTYFVILLLMYRVEPTDDFVNKMRDAYIFTFFGGVEQDHFDARYIFFPMVIGTMIVTIILLNVLIAFMSNVYNKMEQIQSFLSLKEKGSMLLDLEVYISLAYKLKNRSKTSKMDEEEKALAAYEEAKITFFMNKIEGLTNSGGPNNQYTKMLRLEKEIKELENSLNEIGTKNEKQFTSLKKKIKGISKFIGFEQNETSHFDAKMQSILRTLFEDFSVGITENVLETIEEDFNIKRERAPERMKRFSLLNFKQ
jgi:hypothetical protein